MAAAAGFIGGHVARPEAGARRARTTRRCASGLRPARHERRPPSTSRSALRGNHAVAARRGRRRQDARSPTHERELHHRRRRGPPAASGPRHTTSPGTCRWSSSKGKLPDGKRLVSEETLLARRAPQVAIGEDHTYGMGLMVNTRWGIPVVHHGGDLLGYHSDLFWLARARRRRASSSPTPTTAAAPRAARCAGCSRCCSTASPRRTGTSPRRRSARAEQAKRRAQAAGRAARRPAVAQAGGAYRSRALGELAIAKKGEATIVDVGEWKSAVASRKNDDGTVSLITIDPGSSASSSWSARRTASGC